MAKHLVKCKYCGETFDTNVESFVKVNANRYAHKSCAENADNQKSQEEKDKDELEAYIRQLFGISTLTPKIKQQIKQYREKNNYTYSGMRKSLVYFYEVKKNSIEKSNGGIGIIPWVYNDAFTYWRGIWEAQQQNQQVDVKEYILPVREIHIPPPQRQPMKRFRELFTFLEEDADE